jgi:hypothetical protein
VNGATGSVVIHSQVARLVIQIIVKTAITAMSMKTSL